MKPIIVWDLFGGANGGGSVYNALKDEKWDDGTPKYEIYTFDITEPTRPLHFNVSLVPELEKKNQFSNIVEMFDYFVKNGIPSEYTFDKKKDVKLPLPNIIVSSTLCQSFSRACNIKKDKDGNSGVPGWIEKNGKLVLRTKQSYEECKTNFSKRRKWEEIKFKALLGRQCVENTISLIEKYILSQPNKHFYIENPYSSLIWKYILHSLDKKKHKIWLEYFNNRKPHLNKVLYGAYGYEIDKPTGILSEIKIELKTNKIPKSKKINDAYIRTKTKYRSGIGGIGAISKKTSRGIREKGLTTRQISEATPASKIPSGVIKDIFKSFK